MPPVIELDNLSVRLGRREILQKISCRLGVSGTGKAIGLLGPNGAGKSTLIRTLLGFHRPSQGSARILGYDCHRQLRSTSRPRIGYMPENESLIANLTAVQFLRLMGEISGLPAEVALEKAHEVLYHVGLGEARYRTARHLLARHEADGQARAGHRARAGAADSGRAHQRPGSRGAPPHARADPRDEGSSRHERDALLPPAERRGGGLRRGRSFCTKAAWCIIPISKPSGARIAASWNSRSPATTATWPPPCARHGADGVTEGGGRWRIVLPADVELSELWALLARQNLGVRKLTHRRDTLEEIFLKAVGHIRETPGDEARRQEVATHGRL